MTILTFDLSKLGGTSAWCRYDPVLVAAADQKGIVHGTIETTVDGLRGVIERHQPQVVVFESCCISAHLHDQLACDDYRIIVANVNEDEFLWSKNKRKTDKDDALRLARLAATNQLNPVYLPDPVTRQQRQLQRHRNQLTGRRTKIRNSIRSMLQREGIDFPTGWSGWTANMIDQLHQIADPNPNDAEAWRFTVHLDLIAHAEVEAHIAAITRRLDQYAKQSAAIRLLQTIPGVGPRTAEALVAYIGNPHRFKNGKQVAASLGLVPKQMESGDMRRLGRITKRGDKLVRTLLVEVAWLGRRYNPILKNIFDKVCAGTTTRRKTAAVAVARRLAIMAWAMLRDGTVWSPNGQAQPA